MAYRYDPIAHALAAPVHVEANFVGACVVLSLVPRRTTWRYGARSLPVVLLDLGHAVASLLAAATACNIPAHAVVGIPGERLAALAGLPWDAGAVRWPGCAPEYPLAVVHMLVHKPVDRLGITASCPQAEPGEHLFPLVDGALRELCTAADDRPDRANLAVDNRAETLLARRSAAWPLRGNVPDEALRSILAAARSISTPDPPATAGSAAASATTPPTFLVEQLPITASAVGVRERRQAATAHRRRAGERPSPSASPTGHLRRDHAISTLLIRPDEHRELAAALAPRSCGQPQATESAALLLVAGTPEPTPRQARHDLVHAGLAVHQAWLAATRLGLRARPVGCWIDAVLRLPERRRLLHALALGPAPMDRS
ncbi:hypothetical protein GCM10012275_31780 [Longimycelium tulufanense]|uniref:Nitroreductase domain-containing protein n=1 Tax=Longimycelium tulufanense TaxID=907463 RepID=A0A8J3FX22_9PSEU|nr:hypothetical protein GCM10012275_31780 [Longimycelium tulufanense]